MKIRSGIFFICAIIFCFFSSQQQLVAFAANVNESPLKLNVSSDQQSYDVDDEITINLSITNTSDSVAKNVVATSTLPNGLVVIDSKAKVDGQKSTWNFASIDKAGVANISFKIKAKTSGSVLPVINVDTSNGSNLKTSVSGNLNGSSPKTGDETNFTNYFLILIISIIALCYSLFALKKKHIKKQVATILILSLIIPSFTSAKAEEMMEKVNETYKVTVAGTEYAIETNIEAVFETTPVVNEEPSITITSPNDGEITENSKINITGTTTGDIKTVSFEASNGSDSLGSGVLEGTKDWSINGFELKLGTNTITVTALDEANNRYTKTIQVLYQNQEEIVKEMENQTLEASKLSMFDLPDNPAMPDITIHGYGDVNNTTNVTDAINNRSLRDVPGLVGHPIDVFTSAPFDQATVGFTMNLELLQDKDLNNYKIIWFDRENNTPVFLPTSVDTETNRLSTTVNHFSEYGVVCLPTFLYETDAINTSSDIEKGKADVVFVLDSTGSMGSSIANVKNNINSFVNQLEAKKVDVRLGLVDFKDITFDGLDSTKNLGWFTNVDDFKTAVGNILVVGGGDIPETAVDGLEEARKMGFRDNVSKFIVLITDADYKEDTRFLDVKSMATEIDRLKADNITTSVIGATYYQNLYNNLFVGTNGVFADIYGDFNTNLSYIIDKIQNKTDDGKWIRLSNFKLIKLKKAPDKSDAITDTDGDEVPDSQELLDQAQKKLPDESVVSVWNFITDPSDGKDYYKLSPNVPATPQQLAIFSHLSYSKLSDFAGYNVDDLPFENNDLKDYKESLVLLNKHFSYENELMYQNKMGDWQVQTVYDSRETWGPLGFNAVSFYNSKTNEVVMAFKGTDPKTFDLLEDLTSIVLGVNSYQIPSAEMFAKQVINYNIAIDPNRKFSVSGHSLGGFIAQNISNDILKDKLPGVKTENIYFEQGASYNSPGFKVLFDVDGSDRMVNYAIKGDFVGHWNTTLVAWTGGKLGLSYDMNYAEIGKDSTHSIVNFYFRDKNEETLLEPLTKASKAYTMYDFRTGINLK
jgi:uncharacterized repeat protein (TIGR01451 family)